MILKRTILLALIPFLLLASFAFAQQGPPITVGATPVFVYSPARATQITIVQTAGTSIAYTIFSVNGAVIANRAAGQSYVFLPTPPATNFTQGQPIGMISIPSQGTATFRATAVNTSAGVTSLNTLTGTVTLAPGTNITLVPTGNTITINAAVGSFPRLDQVLDPTANKTFAMGGHTLSFSGTPNVLIGDHLSSAQITLDTGNGVFNPYAFASGTNGGMVVDQNDSNFGNSLEFIVNYTGGAATNFGDGLGTRVQSEFNGTGSFTSFSSMVDNPFFGGPSITLYRAFHFNPGSVSSPPTTVHVFDAHETLTPLGATNRVDFFSNLASGAAGNWAIKTGLGKVELGDVIQADNLTASQCVGTDASKVLVSNTNCVTSLASPGAIGGTTPAAGAFTTLTATKINGSPASVSSVTGVTSSNPTINTDQNLIQISLAAGFFNTSLQPFDIDASGIYSSTTASSPAITIKAKLCTVSGCGSGTVVTLFNIATTALNTTALTNATWNLTGKCVTNTTGASGNLFCHGKPGLTLDTGAALTAPDSVFADTNTATSSNIDLTAALFLQFTVAQSATGASNSYTQQIASIR